MVWVVRTPTRCSRSWQPLQGPSHGLTGNPVQPITCNPRPSPTRHSLTQTRILHEKQIAHSFVCEGCLMFSSFVKILPKALGLLTLVRLSRRSVAAHIAGCKRRRHPAVAICTGTDCHSLAHSLLRLRMQATRPSWMLLSYQMPDSASQLVLCDAVSSQVCGAGRLPSCADPVSANGGAAAAWQRRRQPQQQLNCAACRQPPPA